MKKENVIPEFFVGEGTNEKIVTESEFIKKTKICKEFIDMQIKAFGIYFNDGKKRIIQFRTIGLKFIPPLD